MAKKKKRLDIPYGERDFGPGVTASPPTAAIMQHDDPAPSGYAAPPEMQRDTAALSGQERTMRDNANRGIRIEEEYATRSEPSPQGWAKTNSGGIVKKTPQIVDTFGNGQSPTVGRTPTAPTAGVGKTPREPGTASEMNAGAGVQYDPATGKQVGAEPLTGPLPANRFERSRQRSAERENEFRAREQANQQKMGLRDVTVGDRKPGSVDGRYDVYSEDDAARLTAERQITQNERLIHTSRRRQAQETIRSARGRLARLPGGAAFQDRMTREIGAMTQQIAFAKQRADLEEANLRQEQAAHDRTTIGEPKTTTANNASSINTSLQIMSRTKDKTEFRRHELRVARLSGKDVDAIKRRHEIEDSDEVSAIDTDMNNVEAEIKEHEAEIKDGNYTYGMFWNKKNRRDDVATLSEQLGELARKRKKLIEDLTEKAKSITITFPDGRTKTVDREFYEKNKGSLPKGVKAE